MFPAPQHTMGFLSTHTECVFPELTESESENERASLFSALCEKYVSDRPSQPLPDRFWPQISRRPSFYLGF